MPLRPDGKERGPHAMHVYQHGKLGRHMTLINEARSLIDSFIDAKSVKLVDLGRIILAKGQDWSPVGIRAKQRGRTLDLTLVAPKVAQFIQVTFLVGEDLQALAMRLEQEGFDFRMGASS